MQLPDTYSLWARQAPALIGVMPVIAFASFLLSWTSVSWPAFGTLGAAAVLFYAFGDQARQFGKKAEQDIFRGTGGQPFCTALRYRDPFVDPVSKGKYRTWLAAQLEEQAPTEADERGDPQTCDWFYVRCSSWLRERTRDKQRFGVLFSENVTYGFRRNLYGLRWPAIALNLVVVALCGLLLWAGTDLTGSPVPLEIYAVLVFCGLHLAYFLLAVTRSSVVQASDQYARQLALCCEQLMDDRRVA